MKYELIEGVLHYNGEIQTCPYGQDECNINCARMTISELPGQQYPVELNICGTILNLRREEFEIK